MSYIKYKKPTPEEAKAMTSEIAKYRYAVAPHCTGCGIDVGSQGVAAVPWALSVDLPQDKFLYYSGGNPPKGPIPVRCDITAGIPFDSDSLDFVVCSHVIEDFSPEVRPKIIGELGRVLKHGGNLVLLYPDHERWWKYVNAGGVHNFSHHQPQPALGEMTSMMNNLGWKVLNEYYTDVYENDYNIILIAVKP